MRYHNEGNSNYHPALRVMTLFLIGIVVHLMSFSILLAFIVLEGEVLPQKWVKYLPPAQRVGRPELVWPKPPR